MKKLLTLSLLFVLMSGCTLTNLAAKGVVQKRVKIIDQITLNSSPESKLPFSGISDLAYSPQEKKLYLIGDRGYFHIFAAQFDAKKSTLQFLKSYQIQNKNNPDSEGLTFNGDNELIISLEGSPQISRISREGVIQSDYKLPQSLMKKANYKNGNSMFEGLAYHPQYGVLTAAEFPLYKRSNTHQTIYAINGKEWNFQAESDPNSAITALEVMDDNNLLVLERAYNGISKPLFITLKKVYLNQCDSKQWCQSEVLAKFNSAEGWGFNNFEGLAKVGKNRYVMVSDNNQYDFMPTILTYFEILP